MSLAAADVPVQRAVLGSLVERVVPVRRGHGRYGAEITPTPLAEAHARVVTTSVAA